MCAPEGTPLEVILKLASLGTDMLVSLDLKENYRVK